MTRSVAKTMRAVAIERFGGPEELRVRTLPVPEPGEGEVLLRVEAVGVAPWDPQEVAGDFATFSEQRGETPTFPYVPGFDGAGTVAAVGGGVTRFEVGDRVWGESFLNPKGGFYAEYAAVMADTLSHLPDKLSAEQAGGLGGLAVTSVRGLDDTLHLKQGQTLLIHGASGGVGHVAVQLAKRMGAKVLAVASGDDGVKLCEQLGADEAVDGKTADVAAAARAFAPDGLDAALVLASPTPVVEALALVRDGGAIAFPTGVDPAPVPPRDGVEVREFAGLPDRAAMEKVDGLIAAGPFTVHVAKSFPLERAAEAWEMLSRHYLGKIVLTVAGPPRS